MADDGRRANSISRSKIQRTLQAYDGIQNRIGGFLEELAARKSTATYDTMSSAGLSEISGVQDLDIIQRFEEACEFGSGAQRFVWKLQPESTMLITLHWVFDVRFSP